MMVGGRFSSSYEWLHPSDDPPGVGQGAPEKSLEPEMFWGIQTLDTNLDRYYRGAANLHFHFRLTDARGEREPADLCAVFNKMTATGGVWLVARGANGDMIVGKPSTDDDTVTVLVGIVESGEEAESVGVPSSVRAVRLNLLDQCLGFDGKVLDGILKSFPDFVVLGSPENRIRDGFDGFFKFKGESNLEALSLGHAGDEDVVERRTQVIDELPQDDAQHRVGQFRHVKPIDADVVILAWPADADDLIRVEIGVSPRFALDLYHVELCPFELEKPEIAHDLYSNYGTRQEADDDKVPVPTRKQWERNVKGCYPLTRRPLTPHPVRPGRGR